MSTERPQDVYVDIRRTDGPPIRVARAHDTDALWISDTTMGVWFHKRDALRIVSAILSLYPEMRVSEQALTGE